MHAIFFGAVLYEFAKEANEHVCTKISDGEFIDMAFYYGVLDDYHPYRTIRHRTASARASYFLEGRYMMRSLLGQDAVMLRLRSQAIEVRRKNDNVSTNLWKIACERHDQLSAIEKEIRT